MKKFKEVPNIISGKDLDYLSDMFQWNYGAYKSIINCVTKVTDTEMKNMLKKGAQLFDANMKQVLDIVGGNYES